MLSKVKNQLSSIPTWAKWLFVIALAFMVIRWVFKNLPMLVHLDAKVDKSKLQFDQATYVAKAQSLHTLLQQRGTPHKEYMDILRGLNTDDLKAVYNAFGKKSAEFNTALGGLWRVTWEGTLTELLWKDYENHSESELMEMQKVWANTKLWGNSIPTEKD